MDKIIFLLTIIILFSGCTTKTSETLPESETLYNETITDYEESQDLEENTGFATTSPVSSFTLEDINYLMIDCTGSEEETAQCIKEWQYNNMIYAGQELGKAEASDAIRWNYMLPGIFPSAEIIKEHRLEGKVYGVCFDYAVIYCSIAEYYNITCRVANSLSKPSDHDPSITITTGMGPEEYYRLDAKLNTKDYTYSYSLMSSIAEETPEHYWAEAYLNGEWVVMDASGPFGNPDYDAQLRYKNVNDWEITSWESRDPNNKINSFVEETDDLGQTGRAISIDEYMRELQMGSTGIAPYYNSCSKVCAFFGNNIPFCEIGCNMESAYYSCYESCSGKKFYKVCGFICDDESSFAECYNTCSGEEMNTACENNC